MTGTGDSSLSGGAVSSSVGDLAFSNQPYNMDMGSSCGVGFVNSPGTLDGWTMTLGHEWHEMASDQFPAGGWTANSGYENSDECAWIAAGSAGGAANVVMGTGTFTEQASWSNDTNSCAISHAIVSHGSTGGTPTANFSFTTNGPGCQFHRQLHRSALAPSPRARGHSAMAVRLRRPTRATPTRQQAPTA
jgi:hypothetical protein